MSSQLDALRRFVAEHPSARARASLGTAPSRTVVVGAGKGGVGTSVTAALLAIAAATAGRRTLLVDGDPVGGRMHLMLGVEPLLSLASLRQGHVAPDEVLIPIAPTLALCAAGESDLTLAAPATSAERRAMFRRLSAVYDRFELVVIDGGSRLDSVLAACESGAGKLLAVTTPESIALASTYALLKVMHERAPMDVEVLVNRYDPRTAAHSFERIDAAAAHFLGRRARFAGAFPDDASLERSLAAGLLVQDIAAGTVAALSAHAICERLFSELSADAIGEQRKFFGGSDR